MSRIIIEKYSQLKRLMEMERVEKIGADYLTHYLQCFGEKEASLFKTEALEVLNSLGPFSEDGTHQLKLPLKYDVPFPPPKKPSFKFIDLFAGIGGFRIALQQNGGNCVFSSEIDKYARKTYEANFGEYPFGDITKIPAQIIPDHDILCGGFPCQPFSIAGVSKKNSLGRDHGFLDETKGTLFFDIARIIKEKRPQAIFLENVKNLVSHDKGKTFRVIRKTLEDELGYHLFYSVMDGKYHVPQHRERVFLIGFNSDYFTQKPEFQFPEQLEANSTVEEILENSVDEKYTLSDKLWEYLQNYARKHKEKGNGFGFGLVKLDGITRTISARYYKDGSEILIPQEGKNPRRLTPRECARLQGYPEHFNIQAVSNTQLYKQFGNSVVVPLIEEVCNSLVKNLILSKDQNREVLLKELT